MGTSGHVYLLQIFTASNLSVFCLRRRHAFVRTLTGETSDGAGAHLHIPEPQLGAVVRSAGNQVGVVGTPGQVGDTVGVTL